MSEVLSTIGKCMVTKIQVNEMLKLYKVDKDKFKYYYDIMTLLAGLNKEYNARLFYYLVNNTQHPGIIGELHG